MDFDIPYLNPIRCMFLALQLFDLKLDKAAKTTNDVDVYLHKFKRSSLKY